MNRATIFVLCLGFCATLFVQAQPTGSFHGSSDDPNPNVGTIDSSGNETLDFYNIVTPSIQKSYFVGIRCKASGDNICYGVLISPIYVLTSGCKLEEFKLVDVFEKSWMKKYVAIVSRYNSGSHDDDGSETITLKRYYEHEGYPNSGCRAFSIYELEKASKLTPVKFADIKTSSFAQATALTTYGWANVSNEHVITERILESASSAVYDNQ